ncbi:MAG TPA: NIPSNAP family protein [Planctomycetaceae bacterium]|nr:NIPSNAP family protein [Planctomycetaceae bacterium]
MTRHWVWGFLAAGLLAAFGVGWWTGAASAQQASPTMVYELRTYTTLPGRLPALNARFRDHTVKLFAKHGMKNVVYLTPMDGDKKDNTLVYLLAHESRDAAKKSFADFGADPEWKAARDASEKDGKIVEKVESVFFVPTDYSPLK